MPNNKELVNRLRQFLPDILQGTPVTLAYLFGSVAAGQALASSDVDVAFAATVSRAGGHDRYSPLFTR